MGTPSPTLFKLTIFGSLNARYRAKNVTDLIVAFNLNNEEGIISPV